jgi:hypothetical protein
MNPKNFNERVGRHFRPILGGLHNEAWTPYSYSSATSTELSQLTSDTSFGLPVDIQINTLLATPISLTGNASPSLTPREKALSPFTPALLALTERHWMNDSFDTLGLTTTGTSWDLPDGWRSI